MTRETEESEILIEEVRIVEHGRHARRPPRARRYILDIDGIEHVVHQHGMSAVAILDLVGKGPDDWILEILLPDDERIPCEPDDDIEFSDRAIVGFETKKRHGGHGHRHHHHHHDGPKPPPEPCPPPVPPDAFVISVIINGDTIHPPVTPKTLLSDVVAETLVLAKAVGRPDSHWELRREGNLLNQNLTIEAAHVPNGATLYLTLATGAAGDGEMLADPAISRAKFAAEVAKYRKVEKRLIARGQWLLEAEWPNAFAVFAAPCRGSPALVPFGVVLNFEDYDFVPPSVRIVDPFTRQPFKAAALPLVAHLPHLVKVAAPEGKTNWAMQNMMQYHSLAELPFLCLPGVREYHSHPRTRATTGWRGAVASKDRCTTSSTSST